jgi:GAF domain-containing protein
MSTWLVMIATLGALAAVATLLTRGHTPTDPAHLLVDPVRVAAVRALGIIGGPPVPALDVLAREAARQLSAPTAVISLLDAEFQYFPGQFGLGGGPAAVARGGLTYDYSYDKYVLSAGEVLDIGDSLRHPLVRTHRVTVERGLRAYLAAPIRTRDGIIVGSFCVFDTFARKWGRHDHDRITHYAGRAMREMERAHRGPVATPATDQDADETVA